LEAAMKESRRFTVNEYHRLIETGIVNEDDNIELLEGYLVRKSSRSPLHAAAIQKGNKEWFRVLPAGWDFRVLCGVTLTESELEPDIAIVRGDAKVYLTRHPTTADIGLVVEISDSTLASDRDARGRIYAHASIPAYWIVNLNGRQVEVYTSPSGPDLDPKYRQRVDYHAGDSIPLNLGGTPLPPVAVQDLLP
jgi:Uma2 family endonuclease